MAVIETWPYKQCDRKDPLYLHCTSSSYALLLLSVSARAVVGEFSGPYSTVRKLLWFQNVS